MVGSRCPERRGSQWSGIASVTDGAHALIPSKKMRIGGNPWYATELTELLLHVARGLNINRDQATRYTRISANSGPPGRTGRALAAG
jgi:hypothetical protein